MALREHVNRPWPGQVVLYTIDQILALPPVEWAIRDILEEGAFGVIYGPSGDGKSFVALDMALSIATGHPWQGRPVKPGSVIYIVGEGGRGIAKRVQAWLKFHNVSSVDSARFSLSAVQIREDVKREQLITDIRKAVGDKAPALIVLDTLARCFVGGEEDRSKDMGEFVEAIKQVQEVLGDTAVLVVHHTLKTRNQSHVERGSSALRGAADFMMLVKARDSGPITLSTTKQKDHEEPNDIQVRLEQIDLGTDDNGQPVNSCVVVGTQQVADAGPQMNKGELAALRALNGLPDRTARSSVWQSASGMPEGTFQRHRKRLVETFRFVRYDARFYSVSTPGLEALAAADEASMGGPVSFQDGEAA